MKKFMRIALVFALAGAALVGCTKDYSGDISDLNKQVSGIQSTLTSLQTSVQSAQSAADAAAATANTALSAAKEAASAADLKAVQTALAAAATSADLTAVDAKYAAYIPAIEAAAKAADLEALETTITAAIAATDVKVADLEKALEAYAKKADLDEAVTKLAALETKYIALEARVAALEAADKEISDLIAENKAGIETNAEAIAALEKKVEDILAGFGVTDVKVYGTTAITAAYGKFTADGVKKAAEWKGPKAEEIAKIKKGDFVFGTGANEILVQVNPAGADITDAEISLQTSECVEAPIVFGTPVPYEGKLKSENGLWTLPFVVEEFTEEESKEIKTEFNEAKMALVVDGIRTDYNMSFGIVEGKTTSAAPETITEKVADASGEGTFVFKPADAPQILDAYITGIVDVKDSVRFDVTYDGMSFTYDVEKIQKWVENNEKEETIQFKVSYINLVGAVGNATGTLKITYKKDEPAGPTVYTFATVAAHDAVAAYTGDGVSAADKETSRNAQSLVISFKEFYDEFAPTKAEKAVWDEDWPAAATIGFYTAAKNSYDEWETKAPVNDLVEKGTFDAANSKLTIKFTKDYGTATFATNEFFAAVVTFTNDEETIEARVPFRINAPSATEKAKWFNWNGQHAFNGSALEIKNTTTADGFTEIALKSHFNANADYEDVQLLAPIDSSKNTSGQMEYFPGIKLPKFDANVTAKIEGMNSSQIKEYKQSEAYRNDMTADFAQLNWDNPQNNGNVKYDKKDETTGYYKYPYWQFSSNTGYEHYNSLKLYFWNNAYAYKYLNTNLTVSGLKVKAMGGREFSIPDLTIRVVGNVERKSSISFTKDIELGRSAGAFVDLYNALYTPNSTPEEYYGAYTFTDENGQKLIIAKTEETDTWPTITVKTTHDVDNTGKPVSWRDSDACVEASVFSYNSQINRTSDLTTEVGGLHIANKTLGDLPVDVDTVYVEFSIPASNMIYVLNGSAYGDASEYYTVIFKIKVK